MIKKTGTIIKGIGGFYYVKTDDGIHECRARGAFRKEKIIPAIGDRVTVELDGESGSIIEIFPRESYLRRPPAANIDTLMLVTAPEPEPSLFIIDKVLVNAAVNGISAAVCINKTDIAPRRDIADIYGGAGFSVFSVSAATGEGIDRLTDYLSGRTTAFAGASGVGKSSILGIVTDDTLETGSVSEKIRRGRHTTRHVELFETRNGGFVLDTPGFGTFETEDIKADELEKYFPEMADAIGKCRFRGCSHINEPDCAVKEKLERGEIAPSRYESYVKLYERLKSIRDWEKK